MTPICNFLENIRQDLLTVIEGHDGPAPEENRPLTDHEKNESTARIASIATRIFGSLLAILAVGGIVKSVFAGSVLLLGPSLFVGIIAHDFIQTGLNIKNMLQEDGAFDRHEREITLQTVKGTLLFGPIYRWLSSK